MSEEIWKVITGYDNYKISSLDNIRNDKKILKQRLQSHGYYTICLFKDKSRKCFYIHRLVAQEFLEKHENNLIVNHKDGNKLNNCVSNLEWVSQSYNVKHAYTTKIRSKAFTLEVEQYTIDGKNIKRFSSIIEASKETGCLPASISEVCKGKGKTVGGFIWRYVIPMEKIEENDIDGVDIKGYPLYMITRDGKVYSKRKKGYLRINENTGYKRVNISDGKNRKDFTVEKLIKEHFGDSTTQF